MSKTFKTQKGTELPILNLRGKDYLEVKYRIVWLREEHPEYSIETQLLERTEGATLAKAVIKDSDGRILATAHKFEDKQGFPDHTEKAETSAIGRALALIGFGTQFCADELDEGSRLADSPVAPKRSVLPQQPEVGDGDQSESAWKFSFGKWNRYTIEQVYNDPAHGPKALSSYVTYLEDSSKKKGESLSAAAQDAISHIERFLGVMENRR